MIITKFGEHATGALSRVKGKYAVVVGVVVGQEGVERAGVSSERQ